MKDLLTISDLSTGEFWLLVDHAAQMKAAPSKYIRALYEKTLLMIFEAPSLRTRLSFETAMTQLHGHAINYYTVHSPWGVGKESIEDVARTVSRYCDAITARIFSHDELVRLAEHAEVPVINAMTNEGHPCQILGDFLTIHEHVGMTEGVRIAYLGDARNNVTYSLMRAAVLTGNHLRIGCPEVSEYRPSDSVIHEVESMGRGRAGSVTVTADAREAVEEAAVVYADSWMSYRVPDEEKARRAADLAPYRVDAELMGAARKDAVFMHCLPAMRGDEVTAEVIDGPQSIVFDQAENRLHTQKAILLDRIGPVPEA